MSKVKPREARSIPASLHSFSLGREGGRKGGRAAGREGQSRAAHSEWSPTEVKKVIKGEREGGREGSKGPTLVCSRPRRTSP